MAHINFQEFKLLFMREGRLAGEYWNIEALLPPPILDRHRAEIRQKLGSALNGLSAEEEDSLVGIYLAAARSARVAVISNDVEALIGSDQLRSRLDNIQFQPSDSTDGTPSSEFERFAAVSREAREIGERLLSSSDSRLTITDATILYAQLGKLIGAAWHSVDLEEWPSFAEPIQDEADSLADSLFMSESAQDDVRGLTVEINFSDIQSDLISAMVSEAVAHRDHLGVRYPDQELPYKRPERTRAVGTIVATKNAIAAYALHEIRTLLDPLREAVSRISAIQRDDADHIYPVASVYGVSPRGAELWVRDLFRHLGATEAEVTAETDDGGLDVEADDLAVSVKNYAGSVPVEEVREIFAVATVRGSTAVLATSGDVTERGLEFANAAPVAILHYDVATGSHRAGNATGVALLEHLDARYTGTLKSDSGD